MRHLANLAGLSFRGKAIADLVKDAIEPGDRLILERDYANLRDDNAIRVIWVSPLRGTAEWIGFVEAMANPPIAKAMDAGEHPTATVFELRDEALVGRRDWLKAPFVMAIEF